MTIGPKGPQYDREWMLIDKNNNFITQRVHPEMGQIGVELLSDKLVFTAKNQNPLKVPLNLYEGSNIEIKIFGKSNQGIHLGAEYDKWFSQYLNKEVRLVRSPKEETRFTSGRNGPVTPIKFPDGYPLLLTNEATLDELNAKLESPVTMDRFRANIVVTGAGANEEDSWESFNINGIPFLSVKACTRCVVIQLDQETGEKRKDVSDTLSSYRTKDGQIIFGCNLTHQGQGQISIGQSLEF